jgi:hypothetical protein
VSNASTYVDDGPLARQYTPIIPCAHHIRPGINHEGKIARALEYQFRRLSGSSTLHRNGKSAEIVTILRRLEPPEHRFISRKAKVEWNCPVIFQQRVCEVYPTFASDIRPDED